MASERGPGLLERDPAELDEADFYAWTRQQARGAIEHRFRATIARSARRALPDLCRRAARRAARSLRAHPEPEATAALPETCPDALQDLLREGWYPRNRHGLPAPE